MKYRVKDRPQHDRHVVEASQDENGWTLVDYRGDVTHCPLDVFEQYYEPVDG